jgi:hypothetical protein
MQSVEAREQIINLHTGIMSAARRSVQDAIKIGEIISEQKKLLQHGEFLPWVKTLPFDERTAQRYIKLNYYKNKTDSVSDLQSAYRQIENIEQQEKQTAEQRKKSMIAEYRRTGIKPDGWDRSLDYIIKKQDEEKAKFEERSRKHFEQAEKEKQERLKQENAEDIFSSVLNNAANEIIGNMKKRSEWKDKIKVSNNGKEDSFVDAIMDYLDTLEDDNRRIEACYNIIKVCKNIAVNLQKVKE